MFRVMDTSAADLVSTVAGDGTQGYLDGSALQAQFSEPWGIAVDAAGNLYVAETSSRHPDGSYFTQLRKITPAGEVSTLAQRENGAWWGLAVDANGNVFVGEDGDQQQILKISSTGEVSVYAGTGTEGYADGPAGQARFKSPQGICVDATGNVYVADAGNNLIRKIDPNRNVTTLAGGLENGAPMAEGHADGTGTAARFAYPIDITSASDGSFIVADYDQHYIRRVTPAGVVTTIAGSGSEGYLDGPGNVAQFWYPGGVTTDCNGNIFVADQNNNRIRKIDAAGQVSTFAGSGEWGWVDGPAVQAQFVIPADVAADNRKYSPGHVRQWACVQDWCGLTVDLSACCSGSQAA